jgi:hypothetical protein
VLAAGVLFVMLGQQPSKAAVASKGLMLDTARSQFVHADPPGADSLPWRTVMLGELLATDELRRSVARQAGIPAGQLAVLEPNFAQPEVDTPLPRKASDAASITPQRYVLEAYFHEQAPILVVQARAPDPADAVQLADVSGRVLQSLVRTSSARGNSPALVLDSLGPTRLEQRGQAATRAVAVGAALLAFVVWCACVALGAGIRGRFRRARPQLA